MAAADRMKKDPTYPIYELGYNKGLNETRQIVLSHLEDKYIKADDRPDRNTPEAKYLLGLATELADLLRSIEAQVSDGN